MRLDGRINPSLAQRGQDRQMVLKIKYMNTVGLVVNRRELEFKTESE